MEIARAREIVLAINARCFTTLGFDHALTPLDGVSLAEMLEAKRIVENVNAGNKAAAAFAGGRYTINVVPDDRLIAAVYCLDHYPCSRDPVLAVPHGTSRQKVVAVLTVPNATQDDEDD
jgi:hypothetical protein